MPENAAAGAAKPKNKMLPILIVLVLVVVAFGAYYFLFRDTGETKEPTLYESLAAASYYSPGEYFVTNIPGSQALCKTSVSLSLDADEEEFLSNNNAVIRNAILKVLISHPEQEMRAANAIDLLENEMAVSIRAATGLESLQRVFISDFVIQ